MNPYENLVFVLDELASNASKKSSQDSRTKINRREYAAEAAAYEHAADLLREAIKSEHS